MEISNTRFVIAFGLVVIIIVAVSYMYSNKDTIFRNEMNYTYFDGCVETYVNGELTSDECTNAREKIEKEEQARKGMQEPVEKYIIEMPVIQINKTWNETN